MKIRRKNVKYAEKGPKTVWSEGPLQPKWTDIFDVKWENPASKHELLTINHGQPRKTNGQPYLIRSIKIKSQPVWKRYWNGVAGGYLHHLLCGNE